MLQQVAEHITLLINVALKFKKWLHVSASPFYNIRVYTVSAYTLVLIYFSSFANPAGTVCGAHFSSVATHVTLVVHC